MSNNIEILKYSDRSCAVFGDTRPIKDILKSMGGKFNGSLTHPNTGKREAGWIFLLPQMEELRAKLESGDLNISSQSEGVGNKEQGVYKKLNLKKLYDSKEKPRKDVVLREVQQGKMEYAVYKKFDGMTDSEDYLKVTNESFKPTSEAVRTYNNNTTSNYVEEAIRKTIGQSHWVYSIRVNFQNDIGYYIQVDDYYLRYKGGDGIGIETEIKQSLEQPKVEPQIDLPTSELYRVVGDGVLVFGTKENGVAFLNKDSVLKTAYNITYIGSSYTKVTLGESLPNGWYAVGGSQTVGNKLPLKSLRINNERVQAIINPYRIEQKEEPVKPIMTKEQAYKYGADAFLKGLASGTMLNKPFMDEFYYAIENGGNSTELLEAYNNGWTDANLQLGRKLLQPKEETEETSYNFDFYNKHKQYELDFVLSLAKKGFLNITVAPNSVNVMDFEFKGVKFKLFDNGGEFKIDDTIKHRPIAETYFTNENGDLKSIEDLVGDVYGIVYNYWFEHYSNYKEKPAEQPKQQVKTSTSEQIDLNKRIRDLVERNGLERMLYSNAELNLLSRYTGENRKTGGLDEASENWYWDFFTPDEMVKFCWRLAYKYGFVGSKSKSILEPSVGIGRFLRYAPMNCKIKAFDTDKIKAMITKLLYPNVDVVNDSFESEFYIHGVTGIKDIQMKASYDTYDLVIGNPPYKFPYDSYYKESEKSVYPFIHSLEQWFILRSVDSLKKGGLLIFVLPITVVNNESKYVEFKKELSKKCNMLDMYRFPEKSFADTTIATDVIVLQRK